MGNNVSPSDDQQQSIMNIRASEHQSREVVLALPLLRYIHHQGCGTSSPPLTDLPAVVQFVRAVEPPQFRVGVGRAEVRARRRTIHPLVRRRRHDNVLPNQWKMFELEGGGRCTINCEDCYTRPPGLLSQNGSRGDGQEPRKLLISQRQQMAVAGRRDRCSGNTQCGALTSV